ncbi:ABC transporter ATP-binding protein (plasmid) [Diaphorobacter sp. HDW4B]|uniref:ABC transporter ATP-binding protein n=1 Tax=Diaphorobacter sp. HDW4B TaxID=2714925 RepID=UPI00140B7854|nr:ABC transporter ATP-binding protein [Diaphorobacter sp. HDW4B]QIL73801.1 ABC transporter ATP-binding protein [Diaphorobacter sp. HDW4B]
MTAILEVKGLAKHFGGLAAVKNLSFSIQQGQIAGLIGPNGAGKTTAFNSICGVLAPTKGQVLFAGQDITGKRPSEIVSRGLVRTFQSTTTFANETVERNIENALLSRIRGSAPQVLMRRSSALLAREEVQAEIDRVIDIVGMQEWRHMEAGTLAYGLQKKLGIAIGLATRPSMMLMDEPAAGLNHEECNELTRLLRRLRDEHGMTILLVEHHMAIVMEVCERIVVLVHGEKIAEGTPEELRVNPAVVEAYLGAPEYAHA